MKSDTVTYANSFGEMIAPLLLTIRSTGFFEVYVFMPVMTIAGIQLYLRLRRQAFDNGTFEKANKLSQRTLSFGYFTLCFLFTNAMAVAFKTFIIQELDYTEWHWYIPWVAPLHFYIVSVVGAHLYLIWNNDTGMLNNALCAYVQVGLLGGYYIASWRLIHEPFELTDVTTGLGSTFMFGWFSILNWDIVRRFCRPQIGDGVEGSNLGGAHVNS